METINCLVKILIIEDSATQVRHLTHLLEIQSFQVDVAVDGKAALEYLKENRPTLIISDIMMPEMDGYEFCKIVKSDEKLKDIPIILLTSLYEPEDILKGLSSGADNFVIKPYEFNFLLSRIYYILTNLEIRKKSPTSDGVDIFFGGVTQHITAPRTQILDLLLSSYETAVNKHRELEKVNHELKEANVKIKTLTGLIPICAKCKKIRDEEGQWHYLEEYISSHSEAIFSHSYCPECADEFKIEIRRRKTDIKK